MVSSPTKPQIPPAAQALYDKLEWEPTGPEQADILACRKQGVIVVGGEGSGKSEIAANYLIGRSGEDMFRTPDLGTGSSDPILYWLVGDDYSQVSEEYHRIEQDLTEIGFPVKATQAVNPGHMTIQFPGERNPRFLLETKSGKDPTKISRQRPHGIILCEAGQIDHLIFERCYGRSLQGGGWILMIGCLAGDTMIATDEGFLKIEDIVGDHTHSIDLGINGLGGSERTKLAWYNGTKPVKKVVLDKGFEITGTFDHRVITRLPDGSITWVELQDLIPQDLVAVRYGMNLWGPLEWSDEEAYLAGMYLAEGCWETTEKPMKETAVSGVGKGRPGIRRHDIPMERLTFTLGDKDTYVHQLLTDRGYRKHGYHWRLTDRELGSRFREMGIDPLWKAHTKRVPPGILRAERKSVSAFLQGLFDGDGTAGKSIRLDTVSQGLAHDVQMLLLNLGIVSSITRRQTTLNGKPFSCFSVNISDPTAFVQSVGFRLPYKMKQASQLKAPRFLRNQANAGVEFLGYPVVWCHPRTITDGVAETYDLHVPGSHTYWANGLMVHNTLEGSLGWYPQLAEAWAGGLDNKARFKLPTWSNTHLYPGGRQDPKILQIEREQSDEYFLERIAGEVVPPRGLVFPEFRADLHIQEVSFNPDYDVHIWEDPGYGATSAHALMAAQYIDGQVRVFDEIYDRGLLTNEIIHMAQNRPWWKNNKLVVTDPHYKDQHHSVHSVSDVWLAETGLVPRGERVRILPGIERMKTFLKPDALSGRPGIVFAPHCQGILSEFGAALDPLDKTFSKSGVVLDPFDNKSYHPYRWKEDRFGQVVGNEPEDRYNHAIKAVIYGLIFNFGYANAQESKSIKVKRLR